MALFFDQQWFDGKLSALGFTQDVIASALGLTPDQVAEIWKDQREVSAQEVAILAALLQVEPAEIATRAGVSTPTPQESTAQIKETCSSLKDSGDHTADLDEIKKRLSRLETAVDQILALLRAKST